MRQGNPTVSIVLISYNGEKYIQQQLESIFSQSYQSLEIIISDDHSTDGTWEVLQKYASKEKVTLIRNAGERGLTCNLQNALRHASGDFIAISDQDDIWELNKIELLIDHIGASSAIFSDSALIDENGNSLGITLLQKLFRKSVGNNAGYMPLLMTNYVSGHAVMFRRELLEILLPFRSSLIYDHQIGLVAAACSGIRYLDKALVNHRQHASNLTNQLFSTRTQRRPRHERNRDQILMIKESVSLILDSFKQSRPACIHQVDLRHLERIGKGISRLSSQGFQLRLFLLLWPVRHEILYFSKSKNKTFRLVKLCRI